MKPDAWMDETGDCYGEKVRAKYYDAKINLYSAATIRKWLSEVDETVIAAGTLHDTMDNLSDIGADAEGIYRAMIAAKLQELEGGE